MSERVSATCFIDCVYVRSSRVPSNANFFLSFYISYNHFINKLLETNDDDDNDANKTYFNWNTKEETYFATGRMISTSAAWRWQRTHHKID